MQFAGDRALLQLGCANEMIARCLLNLSSFKQRRPTSLGADLRVDTNLDDGALFCVHQFIAHLVP